MSEQNQRDSMVCLAVYPETKETWKEAAKEDPDADSLSQLIRLSVNRRINERTGAGSGQLTEELHETLTGIIGKQEAFEQQLNEVKGQLADIQDAIGSSEVSDETRQLAQDIYDLLPTYSEAHSDPVMSGEFGDGEVPPPEPGSVEWLADQLEVPRYDVRTALDYLEERTYAVKRTDDGDLYYKEVTR